MGKKLFSTKSMFKMPKMVPSTKDLLGNDFKDLGLPRMKPKRRRRMSIAKMLRDV
jgi:hypothetical protein